MTFQRTARIGIAALIQLTLSAVTNSSLAHATFQFTDVTAGAGIGDYVMAAGHGGGVAAADFDNDGDIDIFVPNAEGVADQLYVNTGSGAYIDRAAEFGVADLKAHQVGLWFDYNGDHRLDLVTAGDCQASEDEECVSSLTLYRQTIEGAFEDVSDQAGELAFPDSGHFGGMAAGDINGDEYLDLVVCSWTTQNRLFLNNGDGTFADITASIGAEVLGSGAWQPLFHDFNDDNLLDLYLASDLIPDKLLINTGATTFTDQAAAAGTNGDLNEMGIAPGDFDNDGDIDLFIANSNSSNRLYRNESVGGFAAFTNIAADLDMDRTGWAWGCTFLDADNNGRFDLAITNGTDLHEESKDDPSVFFLNQGGDPLLFEDVSDEVSFNDTFWGGCLIALDYDRNGTQDLAQTVVGQRPDEISSLHLLRNAQDEETMLNAFLTVRPRQDGPNHWAIGALIRVTIGDTTLTRLITAGASYMGQEPAEAHFGLADATLVDALTVEWPDGVISTYEDVEINQLITVTREGYTGQVLYNLPLADPTNQGPTTPPPGMPVGGSAGLMLLFTVAALGSLRGIVMKQN
jgi:hypothetical protein